MARTDMVTFLSLFLWLMTDVHPVEVAADPGVASVEIFLDGESIGVATEPKWEVQCDFGQRLRPHRLVAVARGQAGEELGRAVQLVNLPRANAEVEIVFEGGTPESPTKLRVITESAERLEPLAVFVSFDGFMLHEDGDGRFELPAYDPRETHIVNAEGHFPDGVTARCDLTFGGTLGGKFATELTAVPVILEDRRDLTAQELQGLLRARGEVLTVAVVERQGGRVYMVRDHGAWLVFSGLGHLLNEKNLSAQVAFRKEVMRIGQGAWQLEELPPEKDRFYLVEPNPARERGLAIYPIVRPFSIQRWGLPWLATHVETPSAAAPDQHLAEAVAVAGLQAAADGCPRMVVLVLGRERTNHSGFQPAAVREYLATLHVPLALWSTEADEALTLWGEATAANNVSRLRKASRRMLKDLRRQWIVWVEVSHLPHDIELAENNKGIRLAE
ncbi:MAG: hypothetical protein OQK55_10830 [Thermoanaerobaculales bacterium]|nr:hypothetical protein [Thermoanaerobaculales bacterium]